MAYLPDMSEYNYHPEFERPGTKAIGWLVLGHAFPSGPVDENVLDVLWEFCKISVAQTRGLHACPWCGSNWGNEAQKGAESLLLGSAEIRVFSEQIQIYAAPTLIYHRVAAHQYRPPEEFLNALLNGSQPASREYLALLESLKLEWNSTAANSEGRLDPGDYIPERDDDTPLIDLMARSRSKKNRQSEDN
jgi:hypothetical protein